MSESNEGSAILGICAFLTAPIWLPTALTIAAVGAVGVATVGAGYPAVKGTSAAIKAHQRAESKRKSHKEQQQYQAEYQRRQAEQERKHLEYLQRQAKREAKHQAYLERKEAEREANRMAYFARLTNNVLRFREQYVTLLDDLKNQELDVYIPNEFEQTCQQILQIDKQLASNEIESARDLSLEVGRSIHGLAALARSVKKQVESIERQRKKELAEMQKATSEIAKFIHGKIEEIIDPIEMNFAYDTVKSIQQEYIGKNYTSPEVTKVKKEIETRVDAVKLDASKRAAEWRESRNQENLQHSQVAFIEQIKQNIAADKDDHPEAVDNAIKTLETLKSQASSLNAEELQEKLIAENDKVDGEIADETVRREIVKSIYKTLKQVGFMVTSPVVAGEDVLIKAQKPAGQQAEFAVKLDGHFAFKFDNYEGQKCKTDIDEVTKQLDEIYGVKLSGKKVLWKNPDRIKKGSKELPQGGKERTV